jgi:hypothetical protein
VYVFAPPNVNSPAPAFVKFPLPLTTPFQFTALATVTVEPAVSAPVPPNVNAPLFVPSPNVTSAPMVKEFPTARADPESLETATPAVVNVNSPDPRPASFPILTTLPAPPVTVTPPVNVFTPLNVRTDAPALVNENAPPSTPPRVVGLSVVNVVLPVSVPPPLKVNAPLFVASPIVTAPPNEYPFVNVRAVAESLERAPAVIVSDPVPSAALLPTRTVPELTVTPPENVFAPLNVKTPAPLCTSAPPNPLTTPLNAVVEAPPMVNVFA